MRGLLDNDLLAGTHEVITRLRPTRAARPVVTDDVSAFRAELTRLCQTWGGAGQPILPVSAGQLATPYFNLLKVEQIDCVGGLADVEVELPYRVERRHPRDYPALIIASGMPRDQWRTVQVPVLNEDDPWELIYGATLGTWPEVPDPELFDPQGADLGVRFEKVIPVDRCNVVGSLDDLLSRLESGEVLHPRLVSNIKLAAGTEPDTSFLGPGGRALPPELGHGVYAACVMVADLSWIRS